MREFRPYHKVVAPPRASHGQTQSQIRLKNVGKVEPSELTLDSTSRQIIVRYEPGWEELAPLISAARDEGFRFLERLRDDWLSGENRFQEPGEGFWAVYVDSELVGVGGLNRVDAETARVRRVYVAPSHRHHGVGRALLEAIIDAARRGGFRWLVLRSDKADGFYTAIGFEQVSDLPNITHRLRLLDS